VAGVGVAISVDFAVRRNGEPVTKPYLGKLGEARAGDNNFSFERFDDLDAYVLASLVADAAALYCEVRLGQVTARLYRSPAKALNSCCR
jgi:hypothetical protein